MIVIALLPGSTAQANLLLNPGFEDGVLFPDDWEAWGDGDFAWQNGGARTGDRCMNLGGVDFALLYQRVPAASGEGFTCGVWARYDSGQGLGEMKLEFHDAAEVKILEHKRLLSPSSAWEPFTVTGVAPVGTAYVTATVVGLGGSTVLFDDVSLVARLEDPELTIDVRSTLHTFDGFGVQAWDAGADTIRVYNDLNIRYARIASTTAAVVAAGMGIDVVFLRWAAPPAYLDENNALQAEYVDDYAALWADTVAGLAAGGLTPPYIELSNEPDGNWNTFISPENYSTLVKLTRAELDARGFVGVGIVGPSLTHLDWDNHNSTWIEALDSQAVASLACWGSHTWDDGSLCTGGAVCVGSNWAEFGDSADLRDPTIPKFVTEFATSENTFHGVTYPHPNDYRDYNATNSMPYAVRVYENALALLNSGANAPFIWQATDQAWETKGWGLIDLAGNPKPVHHVLRTLCPRIPVGASVIELGDQSGNIVYAGAFVSDDRLVIGLANGSAGLWHQSLRVAGVVDLQVVEALSGIIDHQGDPAIQDPDTARVVHRSLSADPENRLDVMLPADSTLTIVCDLVFSEGDIDRNGSVNLGDYVLLAGCLAGPDIPAPPPDCTAEQFERADLDGDADVDLHDYARFAAAMAN